MDLLEACCNSRELWDETLLCIQHAIIATDVGGKILFCGPSVEKVLGFSPRELTGKDFSTVLTSEDKACLYPNLLYLVRNNRVFEGELMLSHKNGHPFIAYVIIRPHFGPSQPQAMAIISLQDIDKRKQLEKAIKETHYDDLIKIANGIAHELRNPLVGIGGFAARLFKSSDDNPDRPKYYDHIVTNLKKIENLVQKVELFVKLPTPSFEEEWTEKIMEGALEPYLRLFEERGITPAVNVEKTVLFVDANLIMWAISILVENALDALPSGGRIHFHGETRENHFAIHVTDSGSGISSEDISSIFNPFFSTKPHGAGIDLAIVKRIARIHGGEVGVRSSGGETTFSITLPIERRRSIRISLVED